MNIFDICIVTASSPRQAEVFRSLLSARTSSGLYPREIDFRVYSDPQAGRVGSGGGTLCALRALLADYTVDTVDEFFARHRILMIHAGGESRRMPCYVPEGKIFAPIPVATSLVIPPVVLDLQLTLFLKYPWRTGELVVTSGDVIIDFDVSTVAEERGQVCGFAKPASVAQGSRHGVFKFDSHRKHVVDFFQKQAPEFLTKNAVLEGTTECALDMGIVSLGPEATSAAVALTSTRLGSGQSVAELLDRGATSFDLYLEIMTACLPGLSFDEYCARVASQSRATPEVLRAIFDAFHRFALTGTLTRSTTFLHFGAVNELASACAELNARDLRPFYAHERDELDPLCADDQVVFNSLGFAVPAGRRKPIVAECVSRCSLSQAMGGNVFVGVSDWHTDMVIPEGMCVDERVVGGARIRLVYSTTDTFRAQKRPDDVLFCGVLMPEWLQRHSLAVQDLWQPGEEGDLLKARLFVADPDDGFLAGYWQRPFDSTWSARFRSSQRVSIAECNEREGAVAREARRIAIRIEQLQERLSRGIGWRNVPAHDFGLVAGDKAPLIASLKTLTTQTDDAVLKAYRERLLLSVQRSDAPQGAHAGFSADYVGESSAHGSLAVAVKEDQIVWARSSVRLDLAGGWSDTPPYTLSYGGQVTNLAVDLNGQPPIQVFCRRTGDRRIRVHSIDLGTTESFTAFAQLEDYRDPTSPFGLPKAALCLLGLTQSASPHASLTAALERAGCGLELSLLCAVPKGSGLGTSSVLGATILAALHRFFGLAVSRADLFRQVLQMEQMLTTGGGWQDQIGGVAGGVKYIQSRAGMHPDPVVHQLDPYLFEDPRTHECFTLFYTGVTRLAKNILQDVVARVNERTPAYLFTLDRIRSLAVEAREAIGLRDLSRLARVIAGSWQANKLIHASTTNDEVERMLTGTASHYSAVKLLGAGGGGFALFVSESREQADALRSTLRARFENQRARVVDFALNREGLQVTVS